MVSCCIQTVCRFLFRREQRAPVINQEEPTMTNPPQTEYPVYANRHNNEQTGRLLPPDVEKRTRFAMGDDILLSMKDITAHSGLSDKHYYSLINRGLFPRPLKIGRSSRWRRSDYEAWLNERAAAR